MKVHSPNREVLRRNILLYGFCLKVSCFSQSYQSIRSGGGLTRNIVGFLREDSRSGGHFETGCTDNTHTHTRAIQDFGRLGVNEVVHTLYRG
jgi:hypothetical protein